MPAFTRSWYSRKDRRAYMQRGKNRNISETINRINTNFEDQAQNDNFALRRWSNITQMKSKMATGRHLEKMDMTS